MLSAYLGSFFTVTKSSVLAMIVVTLPFLIVIHFVISAGYHKLNDWHRSENSQCSKNGFIISGVLEYAAQTLQFLLNSEKFFKRFLSLHGDAVIPLKFPGKPIYFAMPGKQVLSLFRNSRQLLPFPSVFDAMSTLFGLPPEDYHIFNTANNSHADSVTPKNDPSRIIMMSQRKDIVFYLQGSNLNWLMQQFTCKFIEILRREPEGPWQMKPDLYQYMTRGIFLAEVDVLYGEGIFKSCPTLCEDFWAFYEAIPVISRNIPTWMSPSSYVAQRKMLNNFRTWQLSCVSESNERKTGVDTTGPDDIWGTHYIRRMYERFRDLGFSEGGIATAMVGFLFLTVANSIPASVWMMLYIFLDKDLRERVEVEISDAFDGGTDLVQTDKLMKAPLLNSICNEVLRLRVGSPFGRTSQSTVELTGGLKVLPGIPIMSVNWLGGLDTKFWNTGRIMPDQFDEHPLEQFWAERFLEYPDDTTSGPLRKDQTQPGETTLAGVSESRVGCARLITNGMQSHWFPFGGGAYRCPGEALGKQIMLISVAVVLRELHIELQNPAAAATTGSKHRTLPFGSHAFDKAVPFKIRVRDRD